MNHVFSTIQVVYCKNLHHFELYHFTNVGLYIEGVRYAVNLCPNIHKSFLGGQTFVGSRFSGFCLDLSPDFGEELVLPVRIPLLGHRGRSDAVIGSP